MTNNRVIFDIGANNGDDISYYLHKASCVVAIEPNELLCKGIRSRFAREIASHRVKVVEAAIVGHERLSKGPVEFFVNQRNDVRSQLAAPDADRIDDFESVKVNAISYDELVSEFGHPWYVKCDIEGTDYEVLRDILSHKNVPEYLSIEIHQQGIADWLLSDGRYSGFKLVDGASVSTLYRNASVLTDIGPIVFSFPHHSAGPMGGDIDGPWYNASSMRKRIVCDGPGWKDLHASRTDAGSSIPVAVPLRLVYWDYRRRFSARLPKVIARSKRKLTRFFKRWQSV